MQIKDYVQTFSTAPADQPVQQLETIGIVAFKKTVVHRNPNGIEPGPMQKRDVLMRNVVLAVLLPECSRPFRSKQLQHQRVDFTGRLWTTFEQPHVAFR